MAKPKTMIIYAASASIAALTSDVTAARERGQAVRLIALEEFRGETEQNAGAVFVQRRSGDELIHDRIRQAYPMIEVQDWTGKVDLDTPAAFEPRQADDDLRQLRLTLIGLGGSAPAGASAAELADLIAAQRVAMQHHPILPNPATQGTTVPDPTPISQKARGDQLVDSRAVGSSDAVLAAAERVSGEPATGGQTAGASARANEGAGGGAGGEEGGADQPTAKQLESRHDKPGLLALARENGVPDVTDDNNKAEIAAKIVAHRDAAST